MERARLDKMLATNEIKNFVIALGTNNHEQFDLSKLRYGRVIIMTDADVDGAHIRTLLLTLFYRHFRQLVENGHLYIAQPPLYQVKKGKESHWIYNDEEKNKLIKKLGGGEIAETEETAEEEMSAAEEAAAEAEEVKKSVNKIHIQRYKGLGEMNPEQLWETTMNPTNRTLLQESVEDGDRPAPNFDILIGSATLPRKKFIQAHAKNVQNLDI